jgi:hypothetical protein
MTMNNPVLAAIDLSGIIPGIEGIIGYPLFRRSIVEIRPDGGSVRISPPGVYPEELSWTRLLIAQHKAFVVCRFEGDREGLFCLDTGHRGAATFHTPAVKKLGLLTGRRTWKGSGSGGVGGIPSKRSGVLDWFEIGGVRFIRPTVDFAQATRGGFCNPYAMGHVGMRVLSHFRLVIDYREEKIAFIKSR